jgi:hypothetical protein
MASTCLQDAAKAAAGSLRVTRLENPRAQGAALILEPTLSTDTWSKEKAEVALVTPSLEP